MFWLVLLVLIGAGWFLFRRFLSKSKPKETPYNPSVFVDMTDTPQTEIDFEAGIRANLKNNNEPKK